MVDVKVKDAESAKALVSSAVRTINLNERQAYDVFCLLNGAFSPLQGFTDETAYDAVVSGMRLPEKQLFGPPVTLDLADVAGLKEGDRLLLRWEGEDIAVMEASSIWKPNKVVEAKEVYGTSSLEHPTVHSLIAEQGAHYVGSVHGIKSPAFKHPTQTPAEVRASLPEGKSVVAFQKKTRS